MPDVTFRLVTENLASAGVQEVTSSLRELSDSADDANRAGFLLTHTQAELAEMERQVAEAERQWDEAHGEGTATAEEQTTVLGNLTEALRLSQADYKAGIITLRDYKDALARIRQEAIAYRNETGLAGREIGTFNSLMSGTAEKATAAHLPLGRLRFQITTLAVEAAGLSGPGGTIARVGSSLLSVFGGAGPAIIAAATIAAIIVGVEAASGRFSEHAKHIAELEKTYGKYKDTLEATAQRLRDLRDLQEEVDAQVVRQADREAGLKNLALTGGEAPEIDFAANPNDIVEDSKAVATARKAANAALAELNKTADEEINKTQLQIEGLTRSKDAVEIFKLAIQGADAEHRQAVADNLAYLDSQKLVRAVDLDAAVGKAELAKAMHGIGVAADAAQVALARLKATQAGGTEEDIKAAGVEEQRKLDRARAVVMLKDLAKAHETAVEVAIRHRAVLEGWTSVQLERALSEARLAVAGLTEAQVAAVSQADAHAAALGRETDALTKLVAAAKAGGSQLNAGVFESLDRARRGNQVAGGLGAEERAAGRPGGLEQGIGLMATTGQETKAAAGSAHQWVEDLRLAVGKLRSEFSMLNTTIKFLSADANKNLGSMKSALDNIALVTLAGLADAFQNVFATMLEQGRFSGKEFAKGILEGIAKAAAGKAGYYFAEGLAALAASVFPVPDPKNAWSAGHYFAAAAEMTAVAATAGFAASKIHSGGPASSGGSSLRGAARQAEEIAEQKGKATIYITGGLLDMSNPDQAEALRKAIADLSDREVILKSV